MLEAKDCQGKKLSLGFCTHCGSLIVKVDILNYNGSLSSKVFKREKAKKEFEKLRSDIIGDYIGKIKYGTRFNMGFRYGDGKEIRDRSGNVVETRIYSVDFNGTRVREPE